MKLSRVEYPLFSQNACKWLFIEALYEFVRVGNARIGYLLSREEFLVGALAIQTTPEGVYELARHPTVLMSFIATQVKEPVGAKVEPKRDGIVLVGG